MLQRIQTLFDSDRLNPVIIKEVRQGNRSKAFLLNFMLAQVAMAIFVIVALGQVADGGAGQGMGMRGGFWTVLGFFLIVGVPMSGINAINHERAEGRLDLLHLSRLSARRIVRGKWLALVVQAVLISVSIIPYLVARYFFGAIDVLGDLKMMGMLLATSAFLTGICVSLSSIKNRLFRILFVVVGFIFLWSFLQTATMYFAFAHSSGIGFGGSSNGWFLLLGVGSATILLLLIAMEFSAWSISPPAENPQSRIRVLYLLLVIMAGGYVFAADEKLAAAVTFMAAGLGCVVFVAALIQVPVALPSIYMPFVRFGRVGKLLGRHLLYPGYPSALYYTVLCLTLFTWFFSVIADDYTVTRQLFLVLPAVIGTFLAPLALALMMTTRFELMTRYVGLFFVQLVLAILSVVLIENFGEGVTYVFALVPLANVFSFEAATDRLALNVYIYWIGSSITLVLSLWYLYRRSREWRQVERQMETRAAEIRRVRQSAESPLTE